MIPKPRSLRVPRNPIGLLVLLAAFAAAAGCSTANTSGEGGGVVVNHVNASGDSTPGWVTPTGGAHANSATLNYIANGGSSSCTECHGSDLAGGISRVSCFGNTANCHHGSTPNWSTPAVHGAAAKKAPGASGFASCRICHGADFRTVRGGTTCFTCHASAPHAPAPWRGSPFTHSNTDPANAPVCAQCHFLGSPNNPANHPATPAPAGTAPGCFNNTLCHGENPVPHPVDNAWVTTSPAAQPHGNDAKAAAGATTGFSYCQTCHGAGTDFAGGSSGVSCYSAAPCHGVNAPHAPPPWRASAGSSYTHTNTDPSNASVCASCHRNTTPGTPGCFNNTLCHASPVPHLRGADWVTPPPAAQPHGNDAKAAPGAAAGFSYCQTCHGTGTTFPSNFGGGLALTCYICHGVNAPHAPAPWRASAGSAYNHTNVNPGNAQVCSQCHFPGSANNPPNHPATLPPAGTPPGCFNNTLCHNGGGGVPHPVPFNDNAHFGVVVATFAGACGPCHDVSAPSTKAGPVCQTCHVAGSPLTALNCTSCHASPPSGGVPAGAAYPNVPGAHSTHIALNSAGTPVTCNTCHAGLGSGTLNHYNRAEARVAPGDVAFPATYNAQSGASSFDSSAALSCSNVSCHGGQATPNWQTGAIDVNTQCTNCHTDGTTSQFNGPTSGNHNRGPHQSAQCTACHNTTALAVNHFTALSTPAMEGPASATIGGGTTLITAGNYNPATRSCTPACHGNETW